MIELASWSTFAASLVTLTALLLFITSNWRWSIGLLAIQYGGVFLLVAAHWPPAMAVTKLISGWIAGAILGLAIANTPERQEITPKTEKTSPNRRVTAIMQSARGQAFSILAALLVAMTVLSRLPHSADVLPGIGSAPVWGGLILMGMGLLKLGFRAQTLPTILGLLTALSGFEVLYSAVQKSVLVAGLLAGVNLALALAGAYLLVAPFMEETE